MAARLIPNEHLTAGAVPRSPASSPEVAAFAQTFNGYEHFGSLEDAQRAAREIEDDWRATGKLPDALSDLRGCLFVEFRRRRFTTMSGDGELRAPDGSVLRERPQDDPSDEDRYVSALVEAIRTAVP